MQPLHVGNLANPANTKSRFPLPSIKLTSKAESGRGKGRDAVVALLFNLCTDPRAERRRACSCQFVNLAAYALFGKTCRVRKSAFDACEVDFRRRKAIRMEREIYLFPARSPWDGMYVCVPGVVKQFDLEEEW